MVLYKYFSKEMSSFFDDRMVRFTPANDFNDLFEGRGQYEWIVSPQDAVPETEANLDNFFDQALLDVHKVLPKGLKSEITEEQARDLLLSLGHAERIREGLRDQVLSVVDTGTPIAKDVLYEGFCKYLGIFCLSGNPSSDTMWGYYTNNEGFAVGLDASHQFFNKDRDAENFLGKLHEVTYLKDLARHQSIATMKAEDMFLTKKMDWSHEAEWRMLDGLQYCDRTVPGEKPIHLFEVPADAIREVIFGYQCSQSLREAMISQIRANADLQHVRLFTVELDLRSSSINLVEM